MQIIIKSTKSDAINLVAKIMANEIKKNQSSVLGLATGNTMECLYAKLVKYHKEESLDFSLVKTYNLDEYIGLRPENKNSYRYYMNLHLFNQVNIDLRNTHLPDGTSDDLKLACREYEESIKSNGGIDLQLLGIGKSGHIGFNEPLSAFKSRTRDKPLTPVTIKQNSPLFPKPEDMPKRALTMGLGTILEAKRIILLVTGNTKAEVLAKAVEGPVTSMISASVLQLHPNCTVVCCNEAAELLQEKEYYNWCFENEKEWDTFR